MVYRPGDREAARTFFEALGCAVSELPGFPWLVINVNPARPGLSPDNVMYANESTPAQQNLEAVLEQRLASDPELAAVVERYRAVRLGHPHYVHHFGASLPTHEQWEQRVESLREAIRTDSRLKGRVDVDLREPGAPGALGPTSQAFIHTDIIQVAPLQVGGLLFELQWAPPRDPDFDTTSIVFPDRLAMV
jgi:hypothetical protein